MATDKENDFLAALAWIVETDHKGYADLSLLGQLSLVREAKRDGILGLSGRLRSFLAQHEEWFLIDDYGCVTVVYPEEAEAEATPAAAGEVIDDWWPQPQAKTQPPAKDKQATSLRSVLTATTRPCEHSPYAKTHAPVTVTTNGGHKADTASHATATSTWAGGRATATARWRESAVSTVTERSRSSEHEHYARSTTTTTVQHTDRFLAPATTDRGRASRRGGRDRDTGVRLGVFPSTGGGSGRGRGPPSQAPAPSPWELAKAVHGPDLGVGPVRVATSALTGAAARHKASGWDVDDTPPWPPARPTPPVPVSYHDAEAVAAEWPDLAPSPPRGRTNSPPLFSSSASEALTTDTQHTPTTTAPAELPVPPTATPLTPPADNTPPATPNSDGTTPTTTTPDGFKGHPTDTEHNTASQSQAHPPDTQLPTAAESNPKTSTQAVAIDQSPVGMEQPQTVPNLPTPTSSSRRHSTKENFLRSVFMSGPGNTGNDGVGGLGRTLWGEKDVASHRLAQYGTLGVVARQPAMCAGGWASAHWGTSSAEGSGNEVNGGGGDAGGWGVRTNGSDSAIGEGFQLEKNASDSAGTSELGATMNGEASVNGGTYFTVDGGPSNETAPEIEHDLVFLNTNEPFCAVAVGVQGSGKSHSLLTVMENCMLHCPPVTHVPTPTATLVFHYDSDPTNMCEAVRLACPGPKELFPLGMPRPTVQRVVVLLSPSFYFQRRGAYAHVPNCTVHPLLLGWDDLTASHLKAIMRVDSHDDQPLYMGVLLDILRRLQKGGQKHSFPDFREVLMAAAFERTQGGPLTQRLRLLESLLAESEENRGAPPTVALADWLDPGTLVVADLTDPMLAPDEANGIFQVLLSQFLSAPTSCPKLAVFDEAHKYLSPNGRRDPLSHTIVHTVRQMRHHGIRVAVSSQSPHTLPPELLELTSVALIHRFHSKDWFDYLQKKLTLAPSSFGEIMALPPGTALCFSSRWAADLEGGGDAEGYGHGVRKLHVRQRLTAPSGRSKVGNY